MGITKSLIIQKLREAGYKANYKNVDFSTFKTKNYVVVTENGIKYKVPRSVLCLQEDLAMLEQLYEGVSEELKAKIIAYFTEKKLQECDDELLC